MQISCRGGASLARAVHVVYLGLDVVSCTHCMEHFPGPRSSSSYVLLRGIGDGEQRHGAAV